MAKQEKGAKSSLFLIELIIVLFFFLLVAAVCVQVFAKAWTTSRSSRELSHAQSQCASVAEVFSGTGGTAAELLEYFPEGEETADGIALYFDRDFAACGDAEAVYTLRAKLSGAADAGGSAGREGAAGAGGSAGREGDAGAGGSAGREGAADATGGLRTADLAFMKGNEAIYTLHIQCHNPLIVEEEVAP